MPRQTGRKWTDEALATHGRIMKHCRVAFDIAKKEKKATAAVYIFGDTNTRYIEEGQEALDLLELEAMFKVLLLGGKL